MRIVIRTIQRMINVFTSARFVVEGDSMSPTLENGQSVVAVRSGLRWNRLERSDIVVFRRLEFPGRIFIKRIVGLPYEQVRVDKGAIYIDDVLLDEAYLGGPDVSRQDHNRTWWNGPGELFLVVDYRQDSQDSRSFGPVDVGLILGLVWLRCWPLSAWVMEPGRRWE